MTAPARLPAGRLRRIARGGLIGLGAMLALIALATAGLTGVYLHSPAGALDLLDVWLPGGAPVARVADGIAFDPGTANRLDIWAAPAPAQAQPRRPVLVFFYGGSWVSGRRQDYGFVGRAYARRGFITVIPDYRKVPDVRFPSFIQDGAAALRWVHDNIARFGGDPSRIVLVGHSAGAHIAVMLALDGRYLSAERLPPDTIKAVAGLAGPYDFYPFTWAEAQAALGNARDPRQTQPIHFARRDAPPLWLGTGQEDRTIAPRNSVALAGREDALGSTTTRLRLFPGVDHVDIVKALSRPFRSTAPILAETDAFLKNSLQGAPAP